MTKDVLNALEANAEPEQNPQSSVGEGIAPPEKVEPDIPSTGGCEGRPYGEKANNSATDFRAHLDSLATQAAALPDFDLGEAMREPDFVRLTAPGVGVSVERAWLALHPEWLSRRAAEDSAARIARSIASGAARPREGGGQGGAPLVADYRALSRSEQQALKQRIYNAAARGEKIYP